MPSRQSANKRLSSASRTSVAVTSAADRESAARLAALLGQGGGFMHFTVSGPGGESADLSSSLLTVLEAAAGMVAEGAGVAILAQTDELTTQDAADALGVSRQYLVRLLDRGDIPSAKVGTHRRVRAADLVAYRGQRDARRSTALAEMADQAQLNGGYDAPISFGPQRRG